jgi:hypothetical protein
MLILDLIVFVSLTGVFVDPNTLIKTNRWQAQNLYLQQEIYYETRNFYNLEVALLEEFLESDLFRRWLETKRLTRAGFRFVPRVTEEVIANQQAYLVNSVRIHVTDAPDEASLDRSIASPSTAQYVSYSATMLYNEFKRDLRRAARVAMTVLPLPMFIGAHDQRWIVQATADMVQSYLDIGIFASGILISILVIAGLLERRRIAMFSLVFVTVYACIAVPPILAAAVISMLYLVHFILYVKDTYHTAAGALGGHAQQIRQAATTWLNWRNPAAIAGVVIAIAFLARALVPYLVSEKKNERIRTQARGDQLDRPRAVGRDPNANYVGTPLFSRIMFCLTIVIIPCAAIFVGFKHAAELGRWIEDVGQAAYTCPTLWTLLTRLFKDENATPEVNAALNAAAIAAQPDNPPLANARAAYAAATAAIPPPATLGAAPAAPISATAGTMTASHTSAAEATEQAADARHTRAAVTGIRQVALSDASPSDFLTHEPDEAYILEHLARTDPVDYTSLTIEQKRARVMAGIAASRAERDRLGFTHTVPKGTLAATLNLRGNPPRTSAGLGGGPAVRAGRKEVHCKRCGEPKIFYDPKRPACACTENTLLEAIEEVQPVHGGTIVSQLVGGVRFAPPRCDTCRGSGDLKRCEGCSKMFCKTCEDAHFCDKYCDVCRTVSAVSCIRCTTCNKRYCPGCKDAHYFACLSHSYGSQPIASSSYGPVMPDNVQPQGFFDSPCWFERTQYTDIYHRSKARILAFFSGRPYSSYLQRAYNQRFSLLTVLAILIVVTIWACGNAERTAADSVIAEARATAIGKFKAAAKVLGMGKENIHKIIKASERISVENIPDFFNGAIKSQKKLMRPEALGNPYEEVARFIVEDEDLHDGRSRAQKRLDQLNRDLEEARAMRDGTNRDPAQGNLEERPRLRIARPTAAQLRERFEREFAARERHRREDDVARRVDPDLADELDDLDDAVRQRRKGRSDKQLDVDAFIARALRPEARREDGPALQYMQEMALKLINVTSTNGAKVLHLLGFMKDDFLITASHISGAVVFSTKNHTASANATDFTRLRCNDTVDFDLVRLKNGHTQHLPDLRAIYTAPRVGESLWFVTRDGDEPAITTGSAVGPGQDGLWRTNCPTRAGDCGGVYLNSQGHVVGVHVGGGDQYNYFVPYSASFF